MAANTLQANHSRETWVSADDTIEGIAASLQSSQLPLADQDLKIPDKVMARAMHNLQ